MLSWTNLRNIYKILDDTYIYKVLNFIFFIFCPVAFFAPKLVVILIFIVWFLTFFLTELPPKNPHSNYKFYFLFFLFISLTLLSCLWSINPWDTLIHSLKISSLFFLGGLWIEKIKNCSLTNHEKFKKSIFSGLIISSVLLFLNHFLGNVLEKITGYSTAKLFSAPSLIMILAIWSIISIKHQYMLTKENKVPSLMFYGSLFLVFFSLFYTNCDTSTVCFLCGFIAFLLVYYLPKFSILCFGTLISILSFFFPIFSLKYCSPEQIPIFNQYIHDSSYLERVNINYRISQKIKERPFLGFGFHSSRFIPRNDENTKWDFIDKNGVRIYTENQTIPMHPHNIFLELWIELGVFGILWGNLFIFFTLWSVQKIHNRLKKSIMMGLYTSLIITTLVSLSPWQTWWLCSSIVFIGIFLSDLQQTGKT